MGVYEQKERDSAAEIAYAESARGIAAQEDQLAGLHTRSSFILAASGIASGTVLGRTGGVHGFGLIAVLGFGIAAGLATYVMFPKFRSWKFVVDGRVILETQEARRLSATDVRVWLTEVNESNYAANESTLKSLFWLFWWACIALAVSIGLTLLSLLAD